MRVHSPKSGFLPPLVRTVETAHDFARKGGHPFVATASLKQEDVVDVSGVEQRIS